MSGPEIVAGEVITSAAKSVGASALESRKNARAELLEAAKGTPEFERAGQNYAKRIAIREELVTKLYYPIAKMLGVSQEYFANDFAQDMAGKLEGVPEENLISPKPSIAAPALEGLTYSLDEPDLKDLYLNLLKTASDNRSNEDVHPSFVRVIREMASEEARLISMLFKEREAVLPSARIKIKTGRENGGSIFFSRHVMAFVDERGEPTVVRHLATYVDNWVRLGLVDTSYSSYLTRENAYDWVKERPEYSDAIKKIATDATLQQDIATVEFDKGYIRLSDFGQLFAQAVSLGAEESLDAPATE
ncbi:DUF4393 domain-containing protein [Kocuria rosea]|uniref:DUF4393 domain-containing protein n=1 Tax=Kocuria rosea TaxID=1275 RepID=UPI000D652DB0|nr:DUF4393 domain-containing protein [Kocuria rosea]PWF79795.1 hypothetical protein DEJ37_17480 [Kocuria rosea]STX02579.1 Uncharacterised protein [Kocuria rosea]